jgi:NAD(P)-dependent dehydrogenase (short-subunit alcohol dehydrogenase family)
MTQHMMDMQGKVALVVGAGPGIGRACALAYATAGADVVVAARRPEPLDALAEEIAALTGRRVEPVAADLSDVASCRALVDTAVERLGGLDALVTVATAGGGQVAIDDADWDSWRQAFEVNVLGTFEVSRSAARSMAERGGGAIVHVSTFGTHSLPPRQAAYTSTKQAAMTASTTLAKELGPAGIRVNVVTPGYTTGDNLDTLFQSVADRTGEARDAVSARFARTAALRCHVDPEDIAAAVLFLSSDASRHITGIEIPVTAGQHPL